LKRFFTIIAIMTSTISMAQTGKATTEKTTFHRATTVSVTIAADAATIWSLLTHAADYPRWNSTIIAIEGNIALHEQIRLRAKMAPKRTFKLKVKRFEPNHLLAWGDGQGTRVYTLSDQGNGTTLFTMIEKMGGLIFPMYAKYIPSFDAPFEQFAADLKHEAEAQFHAQKHQY
jgi:uncharacterized protein YndB with AHSA1/START domain